MRTSTMLAIGAAALTVGCGLLDRDESSRVARPAAYSPPETAEQPWMLIRPPDNEAAVRMVEFVRYLPDDDATFPASKANGLPAVERARARLLFREIKSQPSPRERAMALTEQLVEKEAPLSQWQHVRRFRSESLCEETRQELQEVTREQSQKIAYEPGMLLNDLQFLWLEQSFALSHCVPMHRVSGEGMG